VPVLGGLVAILVSQLCTAQGTPTISKDTQALGVLNSCLDALGGLKNVSAIQDFSASGTVTYYWAGKTIMGTSKIIGLGADRFRVDTTLPDGVRGWAIKGVSGWRTEESGKVSSLPLHQVLTADTSVFFIPRLLASINDPVISLSYVGLEALQDTQVHHLRLQTKPPALETTSLSGIAVKDFYIDSTTLLLVKFADQVFPLDTTTDSLPHSISFSKYQVVNGIQMPFVADETIDSVPVSHVEITSLQFNVGLTDSAFDATQ